AERGDVADAAEFARVLDDVRDASLAVRVDRQSERPDAARPEVGEEVAPAKRGSELQTAVDEAAGDRDAERVVVLVDRIDERQERRGLIEVRMPPFTNRPAVVASSCPGRLVVDFLERALADVANHERTGAAVRGIVEAPAPGVSQPDVPDLGTCLRVGRKGI